MGERRGMNNTHLKNRNRGLVLQLIACEGPLPRVEIARRVGLTKMAVSNIVSELIAEGYVEECGTAEASAAVGRSPTLLRIASGAPGAIGVYLSRDSLSVILADMTCRILLKHTVSLAGETRESLTQKLLAAVAQVRQASPIPLLGIGISTIGPLDAANRLMLKPLRFFGISHYPIAAILEESSGLPAYLENDMNAAALAERLYGVGRRLDHFLYIGLSDGVGAGIISGGRLYRDHNGFVGEIGHSSICFDGPLCGCGNRGCLELDVSIPVICERLHASGAQSPAPEDFEELAAQPAFAAIFRDAAEKLSVAMVNMTNLLDPQGIVIGHEGAFLPAFCLRQMESAVNQRILAAGFQHLSVKRSSFGGDAPLLGSACCVFQELFRGGLFCIK